jgi:outer membrane protein assembly factor BamB
VLSSGYDSPVTLALRPAGASGDVTATHVLWQNRKAAPNTPSPLIVGGEVYLVSDGGIATCSDLHTGKVHWTERLDGNFSASPVHAEGRVYFQSEEGVGYVVRAGKSFELLAENDLGDKALASYAVTDGALFIRTAKHLWKVGR